MCAFIDTLPADPVHPGVTTLVFENEIFAPSKIASLVFENGVFGVHQIASLVKRFHALW